MRTHNYYFPDPAGNILELDCPRGLASQSAGDHFGPEDILHISEIGLVVDDVRAVAKRLQTTLGVEVFRDSSFEDYAQLRDSNGVLILA